jgi:hypothetical protein
MFMGTSTGMVRATMRPPAAAAFEPASSWWATWSGRLESTVSTFQLMGRLAAALMAVSSSTSSSLKYSRQPSTMPSRVVPSCSPTAAHSAMSSSFVAQRDATGWPSPSEWVLESVVENPSPPASMAPCSTWTMASICSGVASLPMASVPMT